MYTKLEVVWCASLSIFDRLGEQEPKLLNTHRRHSGGLSHTSSSYAWTRRTFIGIKQRWKANRRLNISILLILKHEYHCSECVDSSVSQCLRVFVSVCSLFTAVWSFDNKAVIKPLDLTWQCHNDQHQFYNYRLINSKSRPCLFSVNLRVLLSLLKYYAYVMDTTALLLLLFCVHLRCCATSAPDTDSASLLLLIFLFCFVATLCVNKDVYIIVQTVWASLSRWTPHIFFLHGRL